MVVNFIKSISMKNLDSKRNTSQNDPLTLSFIKKTKYKRSKYRKNAKWTNKKYSTVDKATILLESLQKTKFHRKMYTANYLFFIIFFARYVYTLQMPYRNWETRDVFRVLLVFI